MRRAIEIYRISRPIMSVKDTLTDLTKFAKLHPLLVSADLQNVDAENPIYRMRERPFDFVPISLSYSAEVIQGPDTIKYVITGLPFHRPQIVYHLTEPEQGKTEVRLDLTLIGLPFIENILVAMMMAAQDEIMSKLNDD